MDDESTNHEDQAAELTTRPGYVRFGPAEGNQLPEDWLEAFLANMWARHPAAFGRVLMEMTAEITLDGQAWTIGVPRKR